MNEATRPMNRRLPASMRSALPNRHQRSGRAFTLIEILVVMGIIILLVVLALPAFNFLTGSNSEGAAGNQISAALSVARAQAVGLQQKRGIAVFYDAERDRSVAAVVEVRETGSISAWAANQTYAYGEYRAMGVPTNLEYFVCIEPHADSSGDKQPGSTNGATYWRSMGFSPALQNDDLNAPNGMPAKYVVEITPASEQMVLAKGVDVRSVGNPYNYRRSGQTTFFSYFSPAVIIFDAYGQVASVPFRILKNGILGSKLDFTQSTITPFSGAGTTNNEQYRSYSGLGLVTYNRETFRNAVPVVATPVSSLPVSPTVVNKRAADEAWFEQNATPLMLNRYNGTLVKGE